MSTYHEPRNNPIRDIVYDYLKSKVGGRIWVESSFGGRLRLKSRNKKLNTRQCTIKFNECSCVIIKNEYDYNTNPSSEHLTTLVIEYSDPNMLNYILSAVDNIISNKQLLNNLEFKQQTRLL